MADAGPADIQVRSNQLTDERTLLVSSPHFVFERISLAPASVWSLRAERETWLLVLDGSVIAGSFELATGEVLFAQSDSIEMKVGAVGMAGLVAYTGDSPVPDLLRRLTRPRSIDADRPNEMPVPASLTQAKAAATNGRLETIK